MDYTVIGFPRIGLHRELKFAVENHFKDASTAEELEALVQEQRALQWTTQAEHGESLIPSHDYSLYDSMLDTSLLLNVIPTRYKNLNLNDIDTYFAMARGFQKEGKDVKAGAMKKWFNTNYHYIVPELDDDTQLHLRNLSFLDGYRQAKEMGIQTKPVVIGPYTFLKLADNFSSKAKPEFVQDLAAAYREILKAADDEGVKWLQLDEPALVLDLDADDIALFNTLYQTILPAKGNVNVLLQTYFGDVRDCYLDLCALDVDGIGLDFVEGKQSLDLMKTHGFPQDKVLFAGLVNGKNIWKANYAKILSSIETLKSYAPKLVLSTSCSLLHVPYTVANETKLDDEIKKHFSFAYEKLDELRELAQLAELANRKDDPAFIANQELFKIEGLRRNPDVQQALSDLKPEDFKRPTPRSTRLQIQKVKFKLPLLATTTIGSFPQTIEVKRNRAKFRKGEISEEEYKANAKAFIKDCIHLQEDLGLDVLVHGEFERNDMVEFFGENLDGYVFTENAWVQSYGTRGLKPPIVFGDIARKKPITTEYIAYASSLTDKPVKGMLTGPVTILNWSFPREDISTKEMMEQIALAIREEVMDLEAAGIEIIQIDEAALREKLPLRKADWRKEYLDFAIPAFRLCSAHVQDSTQIHTHMCYSEFEDIIRDIDDMDADVITFEASRSNLSILDALKDNHFETEVGPGVYDIHSPRVPSVEEIKTNLHQMLERIPKENLWVNPDCGLKTRKNEETIASLKNLVQAAHQLRAQF